MKIFKKIVWVILSVFVFLLLALNITSLVSRNSNYGVPKVFNTSFLWVKTNSMEPTLKVKTLIIIKSIEPGELKCKEVDENDNIIEEGDIVTFYRPNDGRVVTHRLLGKELLSDGTYTLECFGDNLYSDQCTNNDCTGYTHDYVNSKYLLGKVVYYSYSLGCVYSVISNTWVSLFLILIPGGYVVVSCLVDFAKQAKLVKEEENSECNKETNDEEKQKLFEEAKALAKADFEKELAEKEKKEGK